MNQGLAGVMFKSLSVLLKFEPRSEISGLTFRPIEVTLSIVSRGNNQVAISNCQLFHEP